MCGIAGIIAKDPNLVTRPLVKQMTDIIAHRGPDGEGCWISDDGLVGLGHRRLSIIDLSHEADQPMHFLGRYSIVFNGEIYNYIELREQLIKKGYSFKTQSDTEVLMALYDRDKENCLHLLDGMFSFVLYDRQENQVFCARDRFGEKPFFYTYEKGKHFYYGSEMKCLWAAGLVKDINHRMLFNYLAYGFLDNPEDLSETFYNGCTRLPHAHFLKLDMKSLEIEVKPYYDIEWKNINHDITEKQAAENFGDLFRTSVQRRLRSDVAVGSSLSGGLDSSLVVSVIDQIKAGSTQKQNTFSAVFPGFKKDERKYMDYIIAQTNVEPHFVTPTDEELTKDIDKLFYHQEEPFGSASIYVQYRVMQMAKENKVTVLLDGQGADEMLAGYHHYYPIYFQELKRNNPLKYKEEVLAYQQMHHGSDINASVMIGWKNKLKHFFPSKASYVRRYYEQFKHLKNPLMSQDFFNAYFHQSFQVNYQFDGLNHCLYSATFKRGLQELLRYADRNSMAHSREVRLPFLSHDLVDFLFSLPPSMKINKGWTKWIMRETFAKALPSQIAWRTDKIGYEPPQKDWMKNDNIYAKSRLSRKKLIEQKFINPSFELASSNTQNNNLSEERTWRLLMGGQLL